MKLTNDAEPVLRIGMGEERDFKIKATAKAFRILSSSLYKDKIGAIVRELSANAFDAHKIAGRLDVPFDIHLPNSIEPFFSIKDTGPGLTDEQINEIYTTYFESTKSDSNDYVGALGLGCKSPFSYVKSFMVVSRTDKIRTYDAFISEAGIPAIALRNEQELGEGDHSGLEIIVPVTSRQDCAEFVKRASTAFLHYPTLPTIVGAEVAIQDREIVLEGAGYRFVTQKNANYHYQTKAVAVMGVVAYPIDVNSVIYAGEDSDIARRQTSWNNVNDPLYRLLQSPLEIDFEIGALDVTAGREELSYDPETLEAIRKRLKEIEGDLSERVSEKFKDCASLREAKLTFKNMFESQGSLSLAFQRGHGQYRPKVLFRGEEITSSNFEVDIGKTFTKSTFYVFHQYLRTYTDRSRYETYRGTAVEAESEDAVPTPNVKSTFVAQKKLVERKVAIGCPETIFLKDLEGQWSGRVMEYIKNNPGHYEPVVISCDDPKELKRLIKALDGIKIVKVSELPKPPPKVRRPTSAKVLRKKRNIHNAIRGTYDEDQWERIEVKPDTSGYYIRTYHNQLMLGADAEFGDPSTTDQVSKLIGMALKLKLLDFNTDMLIAVPTTLAKDLGPGWKEISGEIRERVEANLNAHPDIMLTMQRASSRSRFKTFDNSYRFETTMRDMMTVLPSNHAVQSFWEEYQEQKKVKLQFDDYSEVLYILGLETFIPKDNPYDLTTRWSAILKTYPMLEFAFEADRYSHRAMPQPSRIGQYIQQVDILFACSDRKTIA